MKLRNKKTREIKNVNHAQILIHFNDGNTECIKSLAKLNEEWEDYEEPKEYWFIGYDAQVECISENDSDGIELDKSIGNYFESKEEAEKAVERLRAWKRLKEDLVSLHWQDEKDGKFSVWGQFNGNMLENDAILNVHRKDLDLLFRR